jgi:hypothetical protein
VKSIGIPIFGNTFDEPDKAIEVTLSSPENASLDNTQIVLTIVDDDVPIPPRRRTARH